MQKVKFIISHPIQYFTPLFKALSEFKEIDFEVWYCSEEGIKPMEDKGFGTTIHWDIPLLEGYKYKFFKNHARRPSIRNGFMGLWNPGLLSAIQQSPKGTVFILHGWNYATHLMIILYCKIFRHKLIFRGDNPDHHDRMMSVYKRMLKQLLITPLLWLTHRVLYTGKRNYLFFRMYGVSKSKLVFAPHSVDNKRFALNAEESNEARQSVREVYNIPESAYVVICPAKYIPKKRIPDLIQALAQTQVEDFYLLLVGEGPSRQYLENLAQEKLPGRVIFTGFVNQQAMPGMYAASDLLCLPSGMGETWGLAVNEGMNAKLPVIVSNLCGCAEDLVEEGINGYIFPCGDIPALSEYLLKCYQNREHCKAMGIYGAEKVQAYSVENTARGVLESILN